MFVRKQLFENVGDWVILAYGVQIKLVAFDIDGTLTDTMAHLYETDDFLQQYAIEKYPQVKAEELDQYL